jgi:DNA-binding transcriptional regulator LsrR (DeoR family)
MDQFKGIEPARFIRRNNRKLDYSIVKKAYDEGYTQKQIAQVLGCSRQGVASALKVIRSQEIVTQFQDRACVFDVPEIITKEDL